MRRKNQNVLWPLAWIWLVALFCNVVQAAAPSTWSQSNVTTQPFVMGIMARVFDQQGNVLKTPGSKVAVFYEDELRGVADYDNDDGYYFFNLTVAVANTAESGYSFQYYDASEDQVKDLVLPDGIDSLTYNAMGYGEFLATTNEFSPFVLKIKSDLSIVSVTAVDSTATEPAADTAATDTGLFRIVRTGDTTADLTVDYSIDGTATSGTDYMSIGTSVTIPAGEDHVDVTVTPKYDTSSENNETVILTLASRTTYEPGTPNAATVTIVNTPIYTITATNGTASPSMAAAGTTVTITANAPATGKVFEKWTSNDITFASATSSTTTFTMPAKNVTVTATYTNVQYNITVNNGTAKVSNAAVTKAAAGDTVTVTANTPAAGKRFSTWTSSDVTFANAMSSTTTFTMPAKAVTVTATYIDDLPVVSVVATDATATEPTTNTTASDKGTFRISRTAPTTNALIVYFSVSGTATSGTDYTAIGTSATIPAGSDYVDITVMPKYDTDYNEGDETVTVTLTSKTTYDLGNPKFATVNILNYNLVSSFACTLFPIEAVTAGAQWKIDDGSWNDSGVTVESTAGTHTISFKDVTGYTTPAIQTITLATGDTETLTAYYIDSIHPADTNRDMMIKPREYSVWKKPVFDFLCVTENYKYVWDGETLSVVNDAQNAQGSSSTRGGTDAVFTRKVALHLNDNQSIIYATITYEIDCDSPISELSMVDYIPNGWTYSTDYPATAGIIGKTSTVQILIESTATTGISSLISYQIKADFATVVNSENIITTSDSSDESYYQIKNGDFYDILIPDTLLTFTHPADTNKDMMIKPREYSVWKKPVFDFLCLTEDYRYTWDGETLALLSGTRGNDYSSTTRSGTEAVITRTITIQQSEDNTTVYATIKYDLDCSSPISEFNMLDYIPAGWTYSSEYSATSGITGKTSTVQIMLESTSPEGIPTSFSYQIKANKATVPAESVIVTSDDPDESYYCIRGGDYQDIVSVEGDNRIVVGSPVQYSITVVNGTAKVNDEIMTEAAEGEEVTITANAPATGKRFSTWTSSDVTFANATSSTTTFTMPAKNVTVTATYIDDLPVVSVVATDATATEPTTNTTASDKGTFRISRTEPTTNALTVYFSVSGTATSGTDYASIGTSATIPAGSTYVDVTVTPKYDTTNESNETVILTLASRTTYELGTSNAATVTIVNTPIYTITATNGTASPSVATAGATVTVTANAPATGKRFSTWTSSDVTFANATSSTTTFTMPAKNVTVTANYVDDLSVVTVSATDATATEPATNTTASDTGKFRISRTAPTTAALTVYFSVSGMATSGTDYTSIGTSATIPAGSTYADVTVTPKFDTLNESNETVILTLTSKNTYTLGTPKTATVTIVNTPVKYSITVASGTADKSQATAGETVTVTASAPASGKVFDKWTSSDVTFANATSSTTTFTMPTKNVTVTATYIDDSNRLYNITVNGGTADKTQAKAGEIVTITATLPTNKGMKIWQTANDVEFIGSILGATTTFMMPAHDVAITAEFIDKNKMPAVSVRSTTNAGDDTAMEPTSATAAASDKGKFTFTRTMPTGMTGALTVYFDIRGTAENGVDYRTIPSSVTFASGKNSVECEIEPLFDGIAEGDETVELVLIPATPTQTYRGGTYTDATVTVKDPVVAYIQYSLSSSDDGDISEAKWKIDDGDWINSGDTATTTAGEHIISFKAVTGYATPAEQIITLVAGEPQTGTAIYVPGLPTLTVEGGKINLNGTMVTSAQIAAGEEVTITATLPNNQGLKIWTPNKDVEFIGSVLGATTTLKMPPYDVKVTASFIVKNQMPAVSVKSTVAAGAAAGDDTAQEPASATASGDKGKFTFTRTMPTGMTGALTVYFDIRGTAINGTDYKTIPSNISFKSNQSSVECEIEPLFDGIAEIPETIEVVLIPATPTQTYRGGTYTDATVVIENVDPVLHAITVLNGTAKVNDEVVTKAPEGAIVTITANAPAEGETFKNWTSSDVAIQNATSSTTTFTMPAKDVTVKANYTTGPIPYYHPADCMTQDYRISGLEYLQYVGPVKVAALGNFEYTWDGSDVFSIVRKTTRDADSIQTRGGDDIAITRTVSSTTYTAGSIVEVTLTFSGIDKMNNLFIGEKIPEGWTVVGDAADSVVNGVLRATWNALENIPTSFTYAIQAPDGNLAANYIISSNVKDTGCFMDGAMVSITVDDTELHNNCHPADCIDKDNIISGLEYLKYAGPVMALALANAEYTWDGVDVLSIRPKNATRGGADADVAIVRSVDTTTYEANGLVTVTLSINGADDMVSLFVGEKIPEGWSVVGNHADNVRNGVLRMTWDAPNIPSSLTYTLQAPAENLSAIYKIASSSADTGCFVDRVLFLDAGETILTHGSLQKPSEWPQDMALYSPVDGKNYREADNLAITFNWPSILNADGYRLIVATYDGVIVFDETVEENAYTIRGLEYGSYIWNVTAIGDDCIAGTSDDFRFAVVPAVSVPIIVGAVADGTAIKLAFDTVEPGYTDGFFTYQIVFYSLETQTLTSLEQTAAVANGKAVIDIGVNATNGYLYIRPVTSPESSFTELYIK